MFLLIGLTVLLASIMSPYFLTWLNLKNVLISCSVELMIAAGMALVMISGGIDLSVGSIMGVAAIAAAMLFDADVPALTVTAAALGIGVGAGLLNGTLIAYAGLNPLVTTLATMTIWRSTVYILSGGYALSSIPGPFKEMFNAELLGLPRLVWAALAVTVIFDVLMRRQVWFRKLYYLGGNEVAAVRAGLAVRQIKLAAYAISGALAALAAVVLVARMGSAFPNTGTGLELRAITAVVVGGCSVYGGRGSVLGAALGVVLLNLVNNVLVILSFSVYWQGVVAGIVLLLAILTDMAQQRASR